MSARINVRPLAAEDLVEAHAWYEAREAGLGKRFLDAVEARLSTIAARPLGYPIVRQDVRRAHVARFPFTVYFRVYTDEVRILAVVHQSRHPRTWQARVRER